VNVLVTGATGFVGNRLLQHLVTLPGLHARGAVRRGNAVVPPGAESVIVGNLDAVTDWTTATAGIDVVVHCAARVHVMSDTAADPLAEFRRVNVDGTLRLAEQAAEAGVKRFVFISSIKVNGEATKPGHPFTATDPASPVDAYGQSKLEAEQRLLKLASETGMEVVIIRPVLIYGPGVKANFRSMMSWLRKGVPLPLGAIDNRRSLLGVDNLTDLIVCCMKHPDAANEIFLASDGADLSTSDMLKAMGRALGKPARLIPLPSAWLQSAARLAGREAVAQRLCGSLQVDIEKNKRLLGWAPPHSVDNCFKTAAVDYLENQQQ
jgi:nucleoside-diphosphate-sugar epimerase